MTTATIFAALNLLFFLIKKKCTASLHKTPSKSNWNYELSQKNQSLCTVYELCLNFSDFFKIFVLIFFIKIQKPTREKRVF